MDDPICLIKTNLGQLRGQIKTSLFFNKSYYAFRGIPYGKPPIGDLRFKAPQPYGGWEGIRDALYDGSSSKQPPMLQPLLDLNKISFGDEDCLYLNVYTNELPEKRPLKKPVMFSIHGGAFVGGSGSFNDFGPDYLMNEDVVIVTLNYRCGAFGFLSLENEEVPGNAGLKDQTLALQWVKDNIHSFGGDSNNVTIFGMSAGGASTHYQLLSQSSKGLFHKAIIQSGFANNIWAFQKNPRKMALRLAKELGCTSENNNDVLKLLQSVSADDIIVASKATVMDLKERMETFSLTFIPCVEVAGANPFLTDTPENLMSKGQFNKVPVILGCCENEGSVASFFKLMDKDKFESLRENLEFLAPDTLRLNIENSKLKEAGELIWDFYFKDKTLPWEKQINNFLRFASDVYFNQGMEKTRNHLLKHSPFPVYSYFFTNHTRCYCDLISKMRIGDLDDSITHTSEETCHCADMLFLTVFRALPQFDLLPEDRNAIEKHTKAWCSFASVGDPNCVELGEIWNNDSIDKPCFMEIGTIWNLKNGIPFTERVEFWNKLAAKYSTL